MIRILGNVLFVAQILTINIFLLVSSSFKVIFLRHLIII